MYRYGPVTPKANLLLTGCTVQTHRGYSGHTRDTDHTDEPQNQPDPPEPTNAHTLSKLHVHEPEAGEGFDPECMLMASLIRPVKDSTLSAQLSKAVQVVELKSHTTPDR